MPFSRAQSFKFQWDFNYTLSELRGYKKKMADNINKLVEEKKKPQCLLVKHVHKYDLFLNLRGLV